MLKGGFLLLPDVVLDASGTIKYMVVREQVSCKRMSNGGGDSSVVREPDS